MSKGTTPYSEITSYNDIILEESILKSMFIDVGGGPEAIFNGQYQDVTWDRIYEEIDKLPHEELLNNTKFLINTYLSLLKSYDDLQNKYIKALKISDFRNILDEKKIKEKLGENWIHIVHDLLVEYNLIEQELEIFEFWFGSKYSLEIQKNIITGKSSFPFEYYSAQINWLKSQSLLKSFFEMLVDLNFIKGHYYKFVSLVFKLKGEFVNYNSLRSYNVKDRRTPSVIKKIKERLENYG